MDDVFEVRSYCKICHTNCGILVKRDADENVLGVRGDPDNPKSRGYICPKGIQAVWAHNRPDRLNLPLLHGKETDWDTMLDDLAQTIQAAIAKHGPDAVGIYGASGCDDLGWAATMNIHTALGSGQFYTAATVDVGPRLKAAELVTGYAGGLDPDLDLDDERVKLLIFMGSNPLVSHAGMTDGARNLKRFRARGGKIWVLDPVRTRTAALADRHIAPIPGTDPAIFAWLMRELLNDLPESSPVRRKTRPEDLARLQVALEPFEQDRVARISGVEAAMLQDLLNDIREIGRVAAHTGTGTRFGPHALLGEWLRWALLIVTDSLEEPGGMWFSTGWQNPVENRTWMPAPDEGNSGGPVDTRPDLFRNFAQIPCVAMADEIERGPLRVLFVNGGNPLTAFPEPERVKRALESLDALVVLDVVPTSLTDIATHVFACTGRLERAEYNPIRANEPQFTDAVVSPVGDRWHAWYALGQLAKRLGLADKVFRGIDPDEASVEKLYQQTLANARHSFEELKAIGTAGVDFEPEDYRWALELAVPDGKWRIAPSILVKRLPSLLTAEPSADYPLLLTSGRQERRMNTTDNVENPKKADRPVILVSPDDAALYGLTDGSLATLRNQHGQVTSEVAIDSRLRKGVVTFPQGWYKQNVCVLTTAQETDPLTSQPQMTAIPVALEPALAIGAARRETMAVA